MLVFLDSKDLIDIVQHGRPISVSDFGVLLTGANAKLAITHSGIWEFIPHGLHRSRWAQRVSRLDSLPLVFLRTNDIPVLEFTEALAAFAAKREPVSIGEHLLVGKWYETYWSPAATLEQALARIEMDRLVGMDLVHQVEMLIPVSDDRSRRRLMRERFNRDLCAERAYFGSRRGIACFRYALIQTLAKLAITPPEAYEEFIQWLWTNPNRLPGWRLMFEVRTEMRADRPYQARQGDINDLVRLHLMPYVDIATVDAAVHTLIQQVTRRMDRLSKTAYQKGLFSRIDSLLAHVRSQTG